MTFYDFLSLKNDANVVLKVISKKILVAVLKVTDEIAGSGAGSESGSVNRGSVPKCHGSATLDVLLQAACTDDCCGE